jgi:hypothetical protein
MNDLRIPISPFFKRWLVLTFESGSGYDRLSTLLSVKVNKPKVSSIPIAAKALGAFGFWRTLSKIWVNTALKAALVRVDDMMDILLEQ